MRETPPSYVFPVIRQQCTSSQRSGYQRRVVQAPAKKPPLPLSPLEETAIFLSSGWRALMSCCQPLLTSPDVSTYSQQADVPSFLGRVDEDELSVHSQIQNSNGVPCPRIPRALPGAPALPHLRWTRRQMSGQFHSQPAGDADGIRAGASFADRVTEEQQYYSRAYQKEYRVTRPRRCRRRVFPDKARLLSNLRWGAADDTAVVPSLIGRVDEELEVETIEDYSPVSRPRKTLGRGRRTKRRAKPMPVYEALVEHVHYLPEGESTTDEITGIPYFISELNVDDVYFYRVTKDNRRVAHPRTARETAILKNCISNALRGMVVPPLKGNVFTNPPISDATPVFSPTLVVRVNEEEPDAQKDTPDNHSVALARTSRGRRNRQQPGTEKRCRYRVTLRHKMITYSSVSAEADDETDSAFPLLGPVYEGEPHLDRDIPDVYCVTPTATTCGTPTDPAAAGPRLCPALTQQADAFFDGGGDIPEDSFIHWRGCRRVRPAPPGGSPRDCCGLRTEELIFTHLRDGAKERQRHPILISRYVDADAPDPHIVV